VNRVSDLLGSFEELDKKEFAEIETVTSRFKNCTVPYCTTRPWY
jgi:hypothetical protein